MSKTSEEAADFLFPLTRRQTRTGKVTAELAEMNRLPRRRVLVWVQEKRKDHWLAHETLVAVLRGFLRAGDRDAADAVLEALINRLRPAVTARAKRWSVLFPADVDNAEDEAVRKLISYLRSTDAKEEFWECNFTFCFNKRTDDVFKRAAAERGAAVSLTSAWADGEERDRLETLPDRESESAFDDIETQELIQALDQAVPRFAEYLHFHRNGYTDKETAVHLDVTDRTLRNWKDRAKIILTTLEVRP